MKVLLTFLALAGLSTAAIADIQDPPGNDQGPTRKLGRGLGNMLFFYTEIPGTMSETNNREGNSAAASYGFIKGWGRAFYRFGAGVYDFTTWPFPTKKGTYRQPYRSNIPWIHGGYEEFPPELGFDTRFRYSRSYETYQQ